jgi:hypothetical protein
MELGRREQEEKSSRKRNKFADEKNKIYYGRGLPLNDSTATILFLLRVIFTSRILKEA